MGSVLAAFASQARARGCDLDRTVWYPVIGYDESVQPFVLYHNGPTTLVSPCRRQRCPQELVMIQNGGTPLGRFMDRSGGMSARTRNNAKIGVGYPPLDEMKL